MTPSSRRFDPTALQNVSGGYHHHGQHRHDVMTALSGILDSVQQLGQNNNSQTSMPMMMMMNDGDGAEQLQQRGGRHPADDVPVGLFLLLLTIHATKAAPRASERRGAHAHYSTRDIVCGLITFLGGRGDSPPERQKHRSMPQPITEIDLDEKPTDVALASGSSWWYADQGWPG